MAGPANCLASLGAGKSSQDSWAPLLKPNIPVTHDPGGHHPLGRWELVVPLQGSLMVACMSR